MSQTVYCSSPAEVYEALRTYTKCLSLLIVIREVSDGMRKAICDKMDNTSWWRTTAIFMPQTTKDWMQCRKVKRWIVSHPQKAHPTYSSPMFPLMILECLSREGDLVFKCIWRGCQPPRHVLLVFLCLKVFSAPHMGWHRRWSKLHTTISRFLPACLTPIVAGYVGVEDVDTEIWAEAQFEEDDFLSPVRTFTLHELIQKDARLEVANLVVSAYFPDRGESCLLAAMELKNSKMFQVLLQLGAHPGWGVALQKAQDSRFWNNVLLQYARPSVLSALREEKLADTQVFKQ